MSQNPNNNPYGPNPNYPPQPNPSNPNYPPTPGTGYGGQPPSGPNPNYGQPPSGPNPNYGQPPSGPNPGYGQYPPPPSGPGDLTPNSSYGSPYAPPPPPAYPQTGPNSLAGPYDQTVFSQQSGATYPPYPTPSNPGFGTPPSNPGFAMPPAMPASGPGFGMPPTMPPMPPKKSNARTVLISVIALLIVVGGVVGILLYNNHVTVVHNNDLTATAQTAHTTATAQAYANATANAQATATYVKAHYPFSTNQVLNDPMKDNSGVSKYGWDVGSGCTFTNGAYEATESKVSTILPCAAESTHFSNFTFEIQMNIKTGGTGADGGIIFRANMNSDALYIFFLDTQGNYSLDTRANSSGASSGILQSGTVANFATGFYQVHTIGIVANGPQISIYIDQNLVAPPISNSTYSGGQIGVISDYGSSATTVAYTNAKVWQL